MGAGGGCISDRPLLLGGSVLHMVDINIYICLAV